MVNAPLADRRGEHRTEPVPPEPHRFVADIDPAFEQQIFNLPQRERIADVHHHMRRITSGELLKQRKGLRIAAGYGSPVLGSSQFALTMPRVRLPLVVNS